MFDLLVQSEGLPISDAEYTCASTAILGKAATETSADAKPAGHIRGGFFRPFSVSPL